MKRKSLTILGLGLAYFLLPASAQQTNQTAATNQAPDYSKIFKDDREKHSYAVGMNFGSNLKMILGRAGITNDLDTDTIIRGFRESLAGPTTLITEDQDREILMAYQAAVEGKQAARRLEKGINNMTQGATFFEKNKNETGVITTPSGLQYKVITPGAGDSPKRTDRVTVNYKGTLIDGTEFDNSYKRGRPEEFGVTEVIPGWTEALLMMKPGAKWQVFIPSSLAYGEAGKGQIIGPNAGLIFEVELISATPVAPPAASGRGGMAATGRPLTSDIIRVPSAEEMKKGEQIRTMKESEVEAEMRKLTNK